MSATVMTQGVSMSEPVAAKPRTVKPKRRPRGSLALDDIVSGAFELAEEVSIAGLSMPLLAKHMDAPVTSIYWHFRKKEQLLDAMTERAILQYHFSSPFIDGGTWQDGLRNHFREIRRVFQERPVLCELILMRTGELSPEATHTSVDNLEAAVGTLVEAGFKPDDALSVYLALSAFSRGTAMIEHLNAVQRQHPGRRATGVTTAHPYLYELEYQGHSIETLEFEFTLEALISRAEAVLAETAGAKKTRRR
ncbi:TetR family transcriptional regulator [Mycolicibacterium sphagni]|nr:TetR family transcriptional regulator [Mycolicibacterium sphagni]